MAAIELKKRKRFAARTAASDMCCQVPDCIENAHNAKATQTRRVAHFDVYMIGRYAGGLCKRHAAEFRQTVKRALEGASA